ncbi:hypothetical protein [Bradyrhizobium betae]|uniref:hypothetical protein n=1 Tax=Bradyrhizobium betae TaxID=244734 RepID=UPI003D9BC91D
MGAVVNGRCSGRTAGDDVTVFDSSGIALQDLYIGQFLLSMSKVAPNLEQSWCTKLEPAIRRSITQRPRGGPAP